MGYITLFIFSIFIRIIYGYYSHYTEDEARVWQLGYYVLKNSFPLNHGMPVVYTYSLIPGSFQSILSSIPLFISKSPLSLIIFIQIINAFAQLFIYKWITTLFTEFKNIFTFIFIIFSPWSILFSYAWNPSFLPIFSIAYIWGVTSLFQEKERLIANEFVGGARSAVYKKAKRYTSDAATNRKLICEKSHKFFNYIVLLSPLFLTLQINLQVAPLILFTVFLFIFKILPKPSFLTIICSQIPAIITWLPWISYKLGRTPLDEPTWGFTHPVSQSIQLHLSYILDAPHLLLRLLSLVTGDTVNRFERGFLTQHKFIIPLVIIGEICSIIIILVSITFYFSKTRWKKLYVIIFHKSDISTYHLLEKIDFICLLLPIFLIISSLFSVTTLGVHSLLFIIFIPYYVFFRRVQEINLFNVMTLNKIFYPYIFITLAYSLIGGASWRTTFNMVDKIAPHVCHGEDIENALQKSGIIVKEEKVKGDLNYTASLLCPFYLNK